MIMRREARILCWNCRGAGGRRFACEIKELLREYKPKILILLEPRISGETADKVCQKFGKKSWARSESVGFSGGIWVFWEDDEVDLRLLKVRKSFIHMKVRFGDEGWWQLTAVYANPQSGIRRFLWEQLDVLGSNCPWMLIGDFNCVLADEERSSGKGPHLASKAGSGVMV